MPIISRSSYPGPPWYQFNGHLQTILPSTLRPISPLPYERERLELTDGDFLDLDWLVAKGQQQLAILSHGLEGNSQRRYVVGMAKMFFQNHYDVLAWNCRSCSGTLNRLPRLYHHGDDQDLAAVVDHALTRKPYTRVVLIGFSMGGSLVLKYLGVRGREVPTPVQRAVAFSSPMDLADSIHQLERWSNFLYHRKFQRNLHQKIAAKAAQFPDLIDPTPLNHIRRWRDFDRHYSAPLHGFADPEQFYAAASAGNFLANIRRPALLVNALNDPILGPRCYPRQQAIKHPYFYLETPQKGGHVGFAWHRPDSCWSEHRALDFCQEQN